MALSIGGAIYIAVKPLIKIFLNCLMGYILARQNIFTVEVVKSISVLIVNWLMPALIFYNVIYSIKGSDIGLIGVFILTNFIYEALGLFFACIAKLFTPNPKYWTGGLLIAGAMTNIGDIPIAYVTTLAGGSLFSSSDAQRGTAYSVIFLTSFIFTFFNLGGYRLIERDFKKRVQDIENGKYKPKVDPEPGLLPLWLMIVDLFRRLKSRFGSTKHPDLDLKNSQEMSTNSQKTDATTVNSNESMKHIEDDCGSKRIKFQPSSSSMFAPTPGPFHNADLVRRLSVTSYHSTSALPEHLGKLSPQSTSSLTSQVPFAASQDIPIQRFHTTSSIPPMNRVNRSDSISGVRRTFVPGAGNLPSSAFLGEESDEDDQEDVIRRKLPPEDMQSVINAYSQTTRLEKVVSRREAMPRVVNPDANVLSESEDDHSQRYVVPMSTLDRIATSTSVVALKKKKRSVKHWLLKHKLGFLWEFMSNFMRPPSMALVISIILTMIPWTRRLFYQEAGKNNHGIPSAPDGRAPLSFIMDFASFVGNAEVPLGLATLGATISRLSLKGLPKGFWKSVVTMTVLKLVVLPIIAIAWANKVRSLGWISPDNHIAIFVMIISAGVPSATSQIYLTAIYTDPDSDEHEEMDCLAANLIAQYSSLLFTMTILLTYTLKKVIHL